MAADRAHHRDPGSRFEDAGIPDLQDGTPEQQWAQDPEEMPLPGEAPNASVDWGTTVEEQIEGEPHDLRLAREIPDPAMRVESPDSAGDDEQDYDRVGVSEPVGDGTDVGRLVNDQAIEPGDQAPDTDASDVGPDGGGLTLEEQAMHTEPE